MPRLSNLAGGCQCGRKSPGRRLPIPNPSLRRGDPSQRRGPLPRIDMFRAAAKASSITQRGSGAARQRRHANSSFTAAATHSTGTAKFRFCLAHAGTSSAPPDCRAHRTIPQRRNQARQAPSSGSAARSQPCATATQAQPKGSVPAPAARQRHRLRHQRANRSRVSWSPGEPRASAPQAGKRVVSCVVV
jgi:hypothetical protein